MPPSTLRSRSRRFCLPSVARTVRSRSASTLSTVRTSRDYDAIGIGPGDWASLFDTSRWVLLIARDRGRAVGGVTVATGSPNLEMLEGRRDLAVLWDIRVTPGYRGCGVGRRLFERVETWAATHGCRELTVETQNINVPACRFYERLGCRLRAVRARAYPGCPDEQQFLWHKELFRQSA